MIGAAIILLSASGGVALAAGQEPTAAANSCSAQVFCSEANDFTATVTSFRTSTVNGYKAIDASIRFRNKTDRPLLLGYVNQSGFATDDRGNRSIVGGPNGFRGIGLVAGNNFDPKLIVRPSSTGEAQFELFLQGAPQIVGIHFVLDITVAKIKTVEGNQHVLDGEFPLHFEGLANGVSQGAGSFSSAPAGTANAISNLKSLFGKKKSVQNASTIANSAVDTASAVNATANTAPSQSALMSATMRSDGSATPSSGESLPTQERSNQPASEASFPAQQSRSTAKPTQTDLQGAALADPGGPDPNLGTAKSAPSAAKYDVLGIKIGMPAKEAMAILKAHGQYQTAPETIKYDFLPAPLMYGVSASNAVIVRNGGRVVPDSEKLYFVVTMPPSQQLISKVSRVLMFSKETAPTAEALVGDLNKKYGTPSYDSHLKDLYASPGYRELFWVDDAQGKRLLNQVEPSGGYSNQINNCRSVSTFSIPSATPTDSNIQVDNVRIKQELEQGYTMQFPKMYDCANLTIIYARILYGYPIGVSAHDVAGGLIVVLGSAPLDHTAADATRDYLAQAAKSRDLAQKQKAQKNKPTL
jgi:hypothetical protein